MQLKKLIFVREHGIPDLVYRPFEITPVFEEVIQMDPEDLNALSADDRETLFNRCLRLSSEDQGVIPIPGGWQASRLRFMMEQNDDQYDYYVVGYTDRDIAESSTGDQPTIDPETRLIMSSMMCVHTATQTRKAFHFLQGERDRDGFIIESNIDSLLHEMRPASVLASAALEGLDLNDDGKIIDIRTTFREGRVVISDQCNAMPSGFIAKLLQGLSHRQRNPSDYVCGAVEDYSTMADAIRDPNVKAFPLISALTMGMYPTGFTFGDLQKEVHLLDSVTTIIASGSDVPKLTLSPWSGNESQTLLAATIVRHVINLPFKLFDRLQSCDTLYSHEHRLLESCSQVIENADVIADVAFPSNQDVTVFVDVNYSSYITLRIVVKDTVADTSVEYNYQYPVYCDSLALPILTKRYRNLRDIAAKVFEINA